MNAFLFLVWIDYFIHSLQQLGGMSPNNLHLFILKGHLSHVMMDVVCKSKEIGLHLSILSLHCSQQCRPWMWTCLGFLSLYSKYTKTFGSYRTKVIKHGKKY